MEEGLTYEARLCEASEPWVHPLWVLGWDVLAHFAPSEDPSVSLQRHPLPLPTPRVARRATPKALVFRGQAPNNATRLAIPVSMHEDATTFSTSKQPGAHVNVRIGCNASTERPRANKNLPLPNRATLELASVRFLWRMLAKLEAYDRDLALYEQASGEKISDGMRVEIVLNRVTDAKFATHLLLNSERFQTWTLFRRELVDVSRASSSVRSLPDATWSQ